MTNKNATMTLEGVITEAPYQFFESDKYDGTVLTKIVLKIEKVAFSGEPCDVANIMPLVFKQPLPIFEGDKIRVNGKPPYRNESKEYDDWTRYKIRYGPSLQRYLHFYKGICWIPEMIELLDSSGKLKARYLQRLESNPNFRNGFHEGVFQWPLKK